MYAIERTRIIKSYLEENGQAQVNALSNLLHVSEVTVRRDLERLEAEGWLTRTHGGAVINRDKPSNPIQDIITQPENDLEVMDIARLSLRMIDDGDVIMLGSGEINLGLATLIENKSGLTVLTNDVAIALSLSGQNNNRVVLLGGELDKSEKAVFGSMALANLQKYYVSKFFFEIDGFSDNLQLTVNSQEKADLSMGAMSVAGETIALGRAVCFGRNAFFRLGDAKMVHKIVSSTSLPDEFKSRIFQADIPLFTSIAAFEGSQ